MLTSKKRTEEETQQYMRELRAWIEQEESTPAEEMAGFFAARLEFYEDVHRGMLGDVYEAIADYFDEGLSALLDIGCGTGLELHAMFRRFPGLSVTGIDLSPDMLGRLRENFPGKDMRLINGDYFLEPFGEEAFDAAMSFETLHHFPFEKKLGLYQKLHRALRPGGYYIECDYVACCQEEEELCRQRLMRKRRDSGLPEDKFLHIDTPLTLGRQIELLQRTGFVDVRVLYEKEGTVILRGERPV